MQRRWLPVPRCWSMVAGRRSNVSASGRGAVGRPARALARSREDTGIARSLDSAGVGFARRTDATIQHSSRTKSDRRSDADLGAVASKKRSPAPAACLSRHPRPNQGQSTEVNRSGASVRLRKLLAARPARLPLPYQSQAKGGTSCGLVPYQDPATNERSRFAGLRECGLLSAPGTIFRLGCTGHRGDPRSTS